MLSPIPVGRDRALGMSERLAAMTSLTSSLEYLSQRHDMGKGGMSDWDIAKNSIAHANPLLRRLVDLASGRRTTTALHVTRAAVASAMLLPGKSSWRGAGSLFLGATSALLGPRQHYGGDGADQVATLVQLATGGARLVPSPAAKDALLWYVALQSNLSYLISGWVKLLGPEWRDGSALPGVMRTHTYGHEGMYTWLRNNPRAAKLLAHSVLALECLFPLAYLKGGRLARPVIASAATFHVANGYLMGLGRFATAFPAMHPLVAYTSAPRTHPAIAGRDDRSVAAALAVLAGATAAAAITAVQRRMRATEGWRTSRVLTTRHGNRLQYEAMSVGDAERPVFVFAAGLLSTSEHYAWISERLSYQTDYGVIVYARAGYAGSRRRATTTYQLSESVDDLVDLVNGAVAPHRKVILVGHSVGGELVRRAVKHLGDRVHGVVYLDSSHPDQFNRSAQQRVSGAGLESSFASMSRALRLGTGALLTRPWWIKELPAPYHDKVFAHYSDARMWYAARREWAALQEDFKAFPGQLDPIEGVPGLVISAQRTVDRDPDQLLMHRELAEAHRGAPRATVIVEGAGHDTLLVNSRYANQVTDHVLTFFRSLDERPRAARPTRSVSLEKEATR
ncbi:alpha/beta fold hydrolase [Streptomyces sp. MNU76]|nr:alpha/beta fold hydrolase [Streptomyces sp. MNU76]MCC9704893.1 alpha/beta fold hydrolase [Streptomyces sp. MNU76]